MINLCTLFDSNYLDKGLAMYNSIERHTKKFCLYVLCLDSYCYEILSELQYEHLVLISLQEFETEELLVLKKERSRAEYCWTCTAASVEYIIKKFNLNECTYIDSDLYFYNDISYLFDEIYTSNCDVAIMEHRYCKKENEIEKPKKTGKYCVEFNYFNANDNGINALLWWKQECLKWCYSRYEPAGEYPIERYGDQKYLEQFPIKFKKVHVMENLGAGVAPWNLKQYQLLKNNTNKNIVLYHLYSRKNVELIFYHFQNLKYINHDIVNINSQSKDILLKRAIYIPYLKEIEDIRKMLKNRFNLELDVKKSYSKNPIKAFLQKNVMQFRIHTLSDIIDLRKVRDN